MHEKIQKIQNGNGHGLSAAGKFYLLSRQAAVVSVQMNFPKLILIDPGHGRMILMIGVDDWKRKESIWRYHFC